MNNTNSLNLIEAIELLKNGEITSVSLVRDCLSQIKKYNDSYNVFLNVISEEDLLAQAEAADKLIQDEGSAIFEKFPLLGIPYACKDNFNTKGIETTASSNILKGYIPPYESTVTKRLKDAGSILLGKTNLDAFAHGSSTETSDFGPTKNPWDIKRVPGGSSGGSAAAVALNMCTFAIGSETAGSIRCPASWCGITGFKPTYGRVSRYGAIAMASSTDSPGPMTKTVLDSAYILNIIAGKDVLDATSSPKQVPNYLNLKKEVKGLKIGIPKSYFDIELDSKVKELVLNAGKKFEEMGATLVEMDLLDPKYSIAVYTILQRSEVSSNLARFSGVRYGHDRSAFGAEARKRMMLGAYALSSGYYDAYYTSAQKARTLIVNDFASAFKDVDLILGPTMPTVALELGESEKYPMFGEQVDMLQEPSSIAGLTAVSFPCGFADELPVGAQLIAPQFHELDLFNAVSCYQDSTDYHTKFPKLKE